MSKTMWIDALEPRRMFAAGDLAISFGGDGSVVVPFLSSPSNRHPLYTDGAVDSRGRIIVGGIADKESDIGLTRLNANGSVDTSFGGDGVVELGDAILDRARGSRFDLAIDSSDRIVVLSSTGIYRFTTKGKLDKTFSKNGRAEVPVMLYTNALTLDASDRPVIAGVSAGKSGDRGTIVRMTAKGTADTSFGINGAYKRPVPQDANYKRPGNSSTDAVMVLPDGRIVAAGQVSYLTANTSDGIRGIETWRLRGDGNLDPKYGRNGVTRIEDVTNFGGDNPSLNSFAAFAPDGGVYTRLDTDGGQGSDPLQDRHDLTHINAKGRIVVNDFDPLPDSVDTAALGAPEVVTQKDGKLVVYSSGAPALYRLGLDRTLDASFAVTRSSFGPEATLIVSDDRLYVVSRVRDGSYPKFSITAITPV